MNKSELRAIGKKVLKPAESGDIVEWLEANVEAIPDSPMPGPFRSERTPWIAAALRIMADPETKMACMLASIQSAKSLAARLFTCHIIANAPGPCMVLQSNDPEAKDFAIRYLRPIWNNCRPVRERFKADDMDRSTTADFDRMTLYCRGIWNESNLQRLSLRYVIVDECWLAPPGHLAEVSARVTAFGWMGKRIFMSQGGREQQEFHQLMGQTDERDWNFRCPHCDALQPWKWSQVRMPESAKVAGKWDLIKVSSGTTYECSSCKAHLPDNNATRHEVNLRGEFVATKTATHAGYVGLHWNALATMSWGELAVMRLKAEESLEEYGDEEPMRIWVQKRMAEPYREEADEVDFELSGGDFKLGEDWPEEGGFVRGRPVPWSQLNDEMRAAPDFVPLRFMGVDVQKRGFYWIVRAWSGDGRSRLISCGYCFTWGEVSDAQKKNRVHPANTFVDSGDQQDEVLAACATHGWVATRGDQRNDFAWKIRTPMGMKSELRPYSPPVVEAVGQKRVKRFYFSNLRLKDTLNLLIRKGRHQRPKDVPEEYLAQMQSEKRVVSVSGRPIWEQIGDRDNHFWDCEVICILPALAWKLTGRAEQIVDADATDDRGHED